MIKVIFVLILGFSSSMSFSEDACKKLPTTGAEKWAKSFLAKIQKIEPKYRSISWNPKSIPPSRCEGKERVTDGGGHCVYECDANRGGSGLMMQINDKGQLLGFSYYEP